MGLGLNKEEIKKCCEFIPQYDYRNKLFPDLPGLSNPLWSNYYRTYVEHPTDPLYRDFLQLVIEAINLNTDHGYMKKPSCYIAQRARAINVSIVRFGKDRIEKAFDYLSDMTIIEAKEQAIKYVLKHMEAI